MIVPRFLAATGTFMQLHRFITAESDAIIAKAIAYARSLSPLANESDEVLADHIPKILQTIVKDLGQPQSDAEAATKSLGGPARFPATAETAAETHGRARAKSGLQISQLVAEYRALRASVLSLWADHHGTEASVAEVVRFNEAIDQAIAESVDYFSGEMEQMRDIFLGVLGHDLRGPLSAILMTSELISRQASNPVISASVGRLIRSGRRMSSLLDSLLEYNKENLGSGMLVTKKLVNLGEECSEEVEILGASFPNAVLRLSCESDLQGMYDASRIREVVANLVSNAVAYGDGRLIDITLARVADTVQLTVFNHGLEIPAAEIPDLFKPLRRGAAVRDHGLTSVGLGLFIVEQIVRAHGGSVECVSAGGTTEFCATLPLAHDTSAYAVP
jgi:signal transduction histidine kinase